MSARLLDGKAVAAQVRARVADGVADFVERTGSIPGLATVLVGDDEASAVYVASKRSLATETGFADFHRALPHNASADDVAAVLDDLAADNNVAGILLQLPLPRGLDEQKLIERIPASKDVDGLTTASAGRLAHGREGLQPCTPRGVIELLDSAGIEIRGSYAVVIGRSQLVGSPVSKMLLSRDATVTTAHSRTIDLAGLTRRADIIVAAAGVPHLLTADHVREGVVVIDVGIHRTPEGLTGDVKFDEVAAKATWITPVPGGVGPMTIAMLLENTLHAAQTSWLAIELDQSAAAVTQ